MAVINKLTGIRQWRQETPGLVRTRKPETYVPPFGKKYSILNAASATTSTKR